MGRGKEAKQQDKGFCQSSRGEIKEALCSESFHGKQAKTYVKWIGRARSQHSSGMRDLRLGS